MRPLTLRLVLALALFPIVPSSTFVLMEAIAEYWASQPGWGDYLQFWMLSCTVAVTLVSLFIWRACVVWTAGRYAGTVIATAVPIAQVLWWQPLWQVGCGTDMALKVYQSATLVGIWVWMVVWVWWGWGRYRSGRRRRLRMSDSARRVLLSFGVMPIVVGGHLITSVYLDDVLDGSLAVLDLGSELVGVAAIAVILGAIWMSRHVSSKWGWVEGCTVVFAVAYVGVIARSALYTSDEDTAMLALANAIWAPLACLLWVLIWRSVVHWSWTTRVRTCLAATVFLCLAMTAPYLPEDPEISSAVRWLLPLIVWGGWMIATMLLWRFREAALPDRVEECLRCPSCAYSLKGLYGTRCPECGEEPTLDELVTGVLGVDDA